MAFRVAVDASEGVDINDSTYRTEQFAKMDSERKYIDHEIHAIELEG